MRAPGAPGWLRELPAAETLRAVWIQQYYRSSGEHGEKVVRRAQIVSPYDLDARYSQKHGKGWLGYKVHVSETCSQAADDDPDTGRPAAPNLITGVATTEATVPDAAMTGPIHDTLDAHGRDLLFGGQRLAACLLGELGQRRKVNRHQLAELARSVPCCPAGTCRPSPTSARNRNAFSGTLSRAPRSATPRSRQEPAGARPEDTGQKTIRFPFRSKSA